MNPPEADGPGGRLRQAVFITLGAAALLIVVRLIPGDQSLAPADFVAGGPNALEFCDPANPRFLAVVARESPVTITASSPPGLRAGGKAEVGLELRTSTGKPIGPEDLLSSAAEKLNLLVVDPTLEDFHHPEPRPGAKRGRWLFSFVPRGEGLYRVFADLTPAATAREIYASVDLPVPGPGLASDLTGRSTALIPAGAGAVQDNYRFTVVPSQSPVYARQPIALVFRAERRGGGMVPLLPVGGVFIHLVAFDRARTGFVHLRSDEDEGGAPRPPNAFLPEESFRVTFSDPGPYVLWTWFQLAGRETAVPFGLKVLP